MAAQAGRALVIKSVGGQVQEAFERGDMDEAWYKERFLRKLENMSVEEFERQYSDDYEDPEVQSGGEGSV